jgi:ketosteroid isomerase-like protein
MSKEKIVSTEHMDKKEKQKVEENTWKWVKHFIDNVNNQTYEEVLDKMTPDSYFVILGKSPVSGRFSKEECVTKMAPEYARYTVRPTIEFSHAMVDGDQAFLRAAGRNGVAKYGPYSQPYYGYWFRAVKEGYAEIVEFNDTTEMETQMYGKKLVPPVES